MTRGFFDGAADALRGFLPREFRDFSSRTSSRNLKVWFDEDREHYEIQRVGRKLEIGFHAEHPDASQNERVVASIAAREKMWRRKLGGEPEAGAFLGRAREWKRVSEVWHDGDLSAEETAIEAAERLATYIASFEPVRRKMHASKSDE